MKKIFVFLAISFNALAQAPVPAPILAKKPSIISIPIDISVDDIQGMINKKMPELLSEDNSFEDNNNDELKSKVWRKGDLVFSNITNDLLTYEVPLKVWIEKRVGGLGVYSYPSTSFEMKLKFSTKFAIKTDYNILTTTTSLGYDWISKPVLKTGLVDIPIGPVIGKVLDSKLKTYAAEIDKTIMDGFKIKPYVLDAWNMARQPILASEEYKTWIKIEPLEVLATPFRSEKRNIKATLGLKLMVETLVGKPDLDIKKVANIPNLKYVSAIADIFEVQLFNVITYEAATEISQKLFVNQKYEFKDGKYKIEILDINVSADSNYLVLKTKTKGSFKGDIYIKGIPAYDPARNMVILTKTQLDVKTKNFLHKSAAWLLEGYMEKKIEKEFGMPLQEIMDIGKASVLQSINKEYAKGVKMKGDVISIVPADVRCSPEGIIATVNSKAKVELSVKGM